MYVVGGGVLNGRFLTLMNERVLPFFGRTGFSLKRVLQTCQFLCLYCTLRCDVSLKYVLIELIFRLLFFFN